MKTTWFAIFLFGCASLLANPLSVEQKIGQLLMTNFIGQQVNDDAKRLIDEAHVGGIIYYKDSNRLKSPEQVQNISNQLQQYSPLPLFIAIDQEGGAKNRLTEGFTVFPSQHDLRKTGKLEYVESAAYMTGQQLRAVGINFILGPVVDVNVNPNNPVIGPRSFGDNPEQVACFGKAALNGYARAGILSVLKHFPGHGDVTVDSHYDLPVVDKTRAELEKVELFPFTQLAESADGIMTCHLLIPALDPVDCATVSVPILQGLLRGEMGYDGLIVSDSLMMKGVLKQCGSLEKAAERAILAGCDLLIIGDNAEECTVDHIIRVHRHLVEAVKQGRISENRLDHAVARILALKSRIKQLFHDSEQIAQQVNTLEQQQLAEQITCTLKGDQYGKEKNRNEEEGI
jgi:beta-N-acetylhexosaminidase